MANALKMQTIKALTWRLFERGGASLIGLLVQILLARLLTPDDFGALAIMLVFVNVANVLVQSGLNTALVQAKEISDDDFSTVFWMSLCISVVLFAAVFIAAPYVGRFYGIDGLVAPLRVMSLVFVVNAYNAVQVAHVQRSLEFKKIFNATIASVLVAGVTGVSFALLGFGLWSLVVQQLMFQLVNCVVLRLQVSWHPRMVFCFVSARRLFSFGWKLLVSGLLDVLYGSLADLIVGKQFSSTQLGFLAQGKKYPQTMGQVLDGTIQPVMLSAVSKVQSDTAMVKRLVRRALKTSTFLIFPCMAALAVVAEPLVFVLLGEQWMPCVFFLQVYCFTQALLPVHTTNLQALNAMGRTDLFLKLELVKKTYGLAFLLFTAFVLNDVYLMVGSYMITGVVSTFVNAFPNKKVIGYSYGEQVRDVVPALVVTVVSAGIAWSVSLLSLSSIPQIVLQLLVMAGSYFGLSKVFRLESLDYLMATAKEMMDKKLGQQ